MMLLHHAGIQVDLAAFQALAELHGLALAEDFTHAPAGVKISGSLTKDDSEKLYPGNILQQYHGSRHMLTIDIPGYKILQLAHLVMDYNGTLAVDGKLVEGVAVRLEILSRDLRIHVITADTFGLVQQQMAHLPCQVSVLGKDNQAEAKLRYVRELGLEQSVCIGNGRNDRLMLKSAALGLAVILEEGIAGETIQAADVVTRSINDALDLLLNPLRLTATLRS